MQEMRAIIYDWETKSNVMKNKIQNHNREYLEDTVCVYIYIRAHFDRVLDFIIMYVVQYNMIILLLLLTFPPPTSPASSRSHLHLSN